MHEVNDLMRQDRWNKVLFHKQPDYVEAKHIQKVETVTGDDYFFTVILN